MSVLYLNESDVDQLLDMPAVIEVVEEAFRRLAAGEAHNVPRQRAKGDGIVLHSMSAAADYLGMVGWKCYTTTASGAKFHVGLYDRQSGDLIALIQADRLGQLRTGATTGVAAKWLALPDADRLGLLGSGWQAQSQLEAVHVVRPLKQASVYSRDASRRAEFADRMSKQLGIDVVPVEEPRQAVEGFPLVIAATNSRQPVLQGQWISPGAFVAAMGSNWLNKAEIDARVVQRANLIVCDDVECCRQEAGDFCDALEQGQFDWPQAVNLAEVVSKRSGGRQSPDDVVLFKSVGMAMEDVALGHRLFELAQKNNVGVKLPI